MSSREYQAALLVELRQHFGPYSVNTRAERIAEEREVNPLYEPVLGTDDHPDDIVFVNLSYRGDDAWAERIGKLDRLRSLHIDGVPLTDRGLFHLRGLRTLRVLNLRATEITDAGLVHLHDLSLLTHLWLNDNPAIDGSGLVHLSGLSQLEELFLSETGLTNEALPHLAAFPKLTTLFLDQTAVTGAGLLRYLPLLPNLQTLIAGDTRTSQAEAEELKRRMPTLERVDLDEFWW